MPVAYAEVIQKIRAGEVIRVRMRDVLFATSQELSSVERCLACKTNEKVAFLLY